MHTHRFAHLWGWLVLIGIGFTIGGCSGLPFVSQPTRAPQPAATIAPSPTPLPTATAIMPTIPPTPVIVSPTASPPPTSTPTLTPATSPNLSNVKLTTKDLPAGFQDASREMLRQVNLTEDTLNATFRKIGAQARVHNLAVWQHPQRAQVVAVFLLHPLTSEEKTTIETQLANPDTALKEWGSALVGETGVKEAKPLTGADKFGDKSVGFTTTTQMLGVNIRAEAVMSVRSGIVQVVMSFYPEPVPPAISTVDLAKLYDTRLTSILAGK